MARVIGRLPDLERRGRRAGELRLVDGDARWSLAANGAWLAAGVRAGEPFLQISAAPAGSVLAWELARLRALGCVRIGPLWVPAAWLHDGEGYRRVVRLVAQHVLARTAGSEPHYVPKAAAELEPLLALWPFVLVLPTTRRLSIDALVRARAWPVHPLGVVAGPTRADGRRCSPAEFFCHDVDHARFKVREDLAARGVVIADAYRDGTTFDAARGEHRTFVRAAQRHVDDDGWRRAPQRVAMVRRWQRTLAAEPDRALAAAVRWLLFELVHEKSLPLDPGALTAALATGVHVDTLRAKCRRGFYAPGGPHAAAVARLPDARAWLRARLEAP